MGKDDSRDWASGEEVLELRSSFYKRKSLRGPVGEILNLESHTMNLENVHNSLKTWAYLHAGISQV